MSRTLIIGPSWIGDMIMAQVLFKILKQQQPEVAIDVMAPKHSVPLLARMPEVSESITLPFKHGDFNLRQRRQIGQDLKARNYSEAYVLPNSWKSALIPFFAGIDKRTGWVGEFRYGLLNDARRLDKARYELMIERFAALAYDANALLPNELPWPEFDISTDNVQKASEKYGLDASLGPILALCPGAEFGPAKKWPTVNYAKLAELRLAQGWQVWLFGSPKEQPDADIIQEKTANRCVNLTGKTSLGEAIDLMSLARQVVSNDSGLMHMAAALKLPVVAIYGSTTPKFTPPLASDSKIVEISNLECRPCFKRECPLGHMKCLNEIAPEQVDAMISKN